MPPEQTNWWLVLAGALAGIAVGAFIPAVLAVGKKR
jgi:hypothetical protein